MCQRSTLSGFLDTSPHTETLSALDQHTLVLYPVHPSMLQEEKKSGEYSTTFLYLRQNLVGTIWLADLAIIPPVLGFLTTTRTPQTMPQLSNWNVRVLHKDN